LCCRAKFKTYKESKMGIQRMTRPARAVSIKQLPERLDEKRGQNFLHELGSSMNVERPCIVLDCSSAQGMDQYAAHLLLCCLEGAIKRNGDMRLAAVNSAALENLELAGIAGLFKVFDTVDEAIKSFHPRATHDRSHQPSTSAAHEFAPAALQGEDLWKNPN
jgi:anti-sigma B factor antagonist